MRHWKVGSNYDIMLAGGRRIEVQVVQPNVGILAASYKTTRWHQRLDEFHVGATFEGAEVTDIRERT